MPTRIKKSYVDLELSDLFFNHEHLHYDALWFTGDEPLEEFHEAIRRAIYHDAHEFVDDYKRSAAGVTGEELAEDFLLRVHGPA